MSSAGSSRRRAQERLERIEVRRRSAGAQITLEQAIQNRDCEAIAAARRACTEFLQRLRDLS